MSPVKEPRFFALEGHPLDFCGPGDERLWNTTTTTLDAYQRLFEGVTDEFAVGECSVLYLRDTSAQRDRPPHPRREADRGATRPGRARALGLPLPHA